MRYDILDKDRRVLRSQPFHDWRDPATNDFWYQLPGAWGQRDNERGGEILLLVCPQVWTPWGGADSATWHADGIMEFGTPGHGGFRVNRKRRAEMPATLAACGEEAGGDFTWFEEDCAWSAVALAWPNLFCAKTVGEAKTTLRNWYPAAYEKHFNVVLKAGESHVRDDERFLEENKDRLIVTSAFGDWHKQVPKGFVGVLAERGGRGSVRMARDGEPKPETAWFLIPEAEYGGTRFVVDEKKYWAINPLQ